MRINPKGSTLKQYAYAQRAWGAKGEDKQSIALDVGYSANVARSVASHIENKPGFNNAIAKLAAKSNNMALAALAEYEARGLGSFSNGELNNALNAIAGAWDKFNKGLMQSEMPREDNRGNRLKTVILQQIAKQVNVTNPEPTLTQSEEVEPREAEVIEKKEEDQGF